jgi:HrpA-like RNA helicase
LVFLTGQEDIEDVEKMLLSRIVRFKEGTHEIVIYTLYAAMKSEK